MVKSYKTTASDKWPNDGISRIPFALYQDPDIYERELKSLYRGPVWNFLGLDCEIPSVGDYKTTWFGQTPVIMVRAKSGDIRVFENRCSHRGAVLCLERFGTVRNFTCLYHAWSYNLDGDLVGVAFQNGVKGRGGMPADFDRSAHGLTSLRVAVFAGLVFATADAETPDIESYLGSDIAERITRVLPRPVKRLGYHTQALPNNWKLYAENVRDSYHASILHLFFTTFRVNRLSQKGGIIVSDCGGHHVSYSMIDEVQAHKDQDYEQESLRAESDDFALKDPTLLAGRDEFGDGITLQILSVFPNLVLQQIQNSLVVRQILPKGLDRSEVVWTYYGFADDDAEMTQLRQLQSNLVGPAGFISMEDGAIGGFVQRSLPGAEDQEGVVLMGGRDADSQPGRATESSVRGFWKKYRAVMDL